jgi:hypothetical protein
MYTNGYEFELSWSDNIGELSYSVGANFSDFVSKMGDLKGTEFLGSQIKIEGSEFNEWYGYISDGIYQTQSEVESSAKLNANIKPGDIKFKDISGPDGIPDGKISSEYDRILLGGSLPRFLYGANLRIEYKNFDFYSVIQGVGKQNSLMTTEMVQPLRANWANIPNIIDGNYWSKYNTEEQNKDVFYPRLTYSNASSNYVMSDYWLFNGRYIRLKNITIGYRLPNSFCEKIKINNARLYVSGNDIVTLNKYPKGWDPETGSNSYPITSYYSFGFNINF